jgi:hypothetical protein
MNQDSQIQATKPPPAAINAQQDVLTSLTDIQSELSGGNWTGSANSGGRS